ncbi:Phosphoribosylaminoimidazole carboxylase [Gonapodya prolifera JEL478]|uniref:Phosphoribosylaminoimidazole carboxylase n=1 Tax=Gonapodya prolifera (strain JEL478) TaxID=1344416 RepID=A0A139A709_GONPJ|nr:Phosphoribosylaminoimidazole carboxylase [Gonapodya prolifera JEL478]|eukprot:KXS12438.1 Phosphoribosylaminoimidazole carboxylase [Gonapodya prolifera JEL478]
MSAPNPRGKRVGVLGGGQLGRMMMDPAHRLGIKLLVLDAHDAPARHVSGFAGHVVGDFKDPAKIAELAKSVDVVTVEIEHVNAEALADVVKTNTGVDIQPSPNTIRTIQDKFAQKELLNSHGVPLGAFRRVESREDAVAVGEEFGYPYMLKSRTLAYDGKGNAVVASAADVDGAMSKLGSSVGKPTPLYAEKWVPFVKEMAVMVVRGLDGQLASYPVVETVHKNSILDLCFAPAQVDGLVAKKARGVAEKAVGCFDGAGMYGVELFLLKDGTILLNEIAPRPHNSGHYTIEACHTSQFENHLRAILGLPLGACGLKVGAAAMYNIVGSSDGDGGMKEVEQIVASAMGVPGAAVHLYGKKECRRGRKMGHVTVTGDTMSQVVDRVSAILSPSRLSPTTTTTAGTPLTQPTPLTSLTPLISIIMGSDSDLPVLTPAAHILTTFGVPFEISIVSAHRTPLRMVEYARTAHERGIKAIIAAAGGAAHLPGMVAALTCLPVIGVPVKLGVLDGVDSLYSIVQMPRGVPVATVAINNSTNAALLAVRILGAFVPALAKKVTEYAENAEREVMSKVERLDEVGWEGYVGK